MNDIAFFTNKALYLVLILSALPVMVATLIGLVVGLLQTVTQLQEQTLPFGLKMLGVIVSLFLLGGWYGEVLMTFGREVIAVALL